MKKGRKKEQPVKCIRKTLFNPNLRATVSFNQIMRTADPNCSFVRRPATASYETLSFFAPVDGEVGLHSYKVKGLAPEQL